jgi:hypothetical protein
MEGVSFIQVEVEEVQVRVDIVVIIQIEVDVDSVIIVMIFHSIARVPHQQIMQVVGPGNNNVWFRTRP